MLEFEETNNPEFKLCIGNRIDNEVLEIGIEEPCEYTCTFINKQTALTVVKHLKELFNLTEEEIRI